MLKSTIRGPSLTFVESKPLWSEHQESRNKCAECKVHCLRGQIRVHCLVAPALRTHQTQLCSQGPGSNPSMSLCHHPPGISALRHLQASWAWCHSMFSPGGNLDLACQPAQTI